MPGDGNCFFHSVCYFLRKRAINTNPAEIPELVADTLRNDPKTYVSDDDNDMLLVDLLAPLEATSDIAVDIVVGQAVAYIYKFNICHHHYNNGVQETTMQFVYDPEWPIYHIKLSRYSGAAVGHFEPLEYQLTDEDKTTFEKLIDEVYYDHVPYDESNDALIQHYDTIISMYSV